MYSELTHLWVQQLLWSVVETSPSWGVASICPFKLHVLLLMFLDLHLQISWTQTIYLRSHFFVQFFWYNFFVLFLSKTTKLNLLVSLHSISQMKQNCYRENRERKKGRRRYIEREGEIRERGERDRESKILVKYPNREIKRKERLITKIMTW